MRHQFLDVTNAHKNTHAHRAHTHSTDIRHNSFSAYPLVNARNSCHDVISFVSFKLLLTHDLHTFDRSIHFCNHAVQLAQPAGPRACNVWHVGGRTAQCFGGGNTDMTFDKFGAPSFKGTQKDYRLVCCESCIRDAVRPASARFLLSPLD